MINFNELNKAKAMKDLNTFIDKLTNERDSLLETVKNYNKDEHIAKLKEENDKLRVNSLHTLSDKEKIDAKVFVDEHWKGCKGSTRYILESTGIGTGVTVQCTKCNKTKNITDVSNW